MTWSDYRVVHGLYDQCCTRGLSMHDRRGLIEIKAEIKGWRSK